ncbi:MAG: hypothetical protein GX595_02145 [Lentisphaerae bacterium]|nr:hypothetical protein [Lentisphaerota bacterium]
MTLRAFTVGILCALFIAGFGYVNDWILDLERFTSGHLLPVMVIGPLILFVATINILLFRHRRSWALTGPELAVIFVLTSTACCVPGRNLMEHLPHVMVMPHHWYRVNPGLRERNLMQYFPKDALVDPEYSPEVVSGFLTGMGAPEDRNLPWLERIGVQIRRVPWGAWVRPLMVWLPLAFLGMVCYGCLAIILHRQWSHHEHLAYPIADFVASVLGRKDDESATPAVRNRLFWVGLGVVLLIRVNNGLCVWFPDVFIPVKLTFIFTPFMTLFPAAGRVLWGPGLFRFELFPLMVAFAFLLSSEIALTMGVSQILWVLFAAPLVTMGMDFSTDYSGIGWSGWQRGGSYIAFALMLAYTGRHYYGRILSGAVAVWRRLREEDRGAVWAMRLLLLAGALTVVLVMRLGMNFPFAAATVGLALLSCVVVSRISAETGLFFIHTRWQPFSFLLAMVGGTMMNPSLVVASVMVFFVLSIDQSQAYLPYLANGLKVCERLRLPQIRLTGVTLAVCVAGVFLALLVGLTATYDTGTPRQCAWSYNVLPKLAFEAVEPEVLKLQAVDRLAEAETLPWHAKLRDLRPQKHFLSAAGFGFFAVLLFSFLRLRLPRWPLHPVLFLVWVTWPMYALSYSILLGWLVKTLTIRFGGYSTVQRLKPLMFGVIGGEILGALVFMIAGAVYFLVTGKPPVAYRYFPR